MHPGLSISRGEDAKSWEHGWAQFHAQKYGYSQYPRQNDSPDTNVYAQARKK